MVIPMRNTPLGDPPEEAMPKLNVIKYTVIGVWLCVIGRVLSGDIGGCMGDIIFGLNGIFLLKDDPSLKSCYECLMRTFIGQCAGPGGGGMNCLRSFMMMAAINIAFDILSLGQVMYRPFVAVSGILQVLGVYMAYAVFQMVSNGEGLMGNMGGPQDDGSGGGAYQGAPDGGAAQAPASQQMAGREMSSAAPAGFTPFSGGGQRLGG